MKKVEAWKNFNLGQELSVSGTFIYNGLRKFHEMQTLEYTDEIFEVVYNLSVGLERLLKITVVLLEHNDSSNQEELEKSLITHNHLELLKRVKLHITPSLGTAHNEFLALLGTFYTTFRYDRFTLSSVNNFDREKVALCQFLSKQLDVDLNKKSSIFATQNDTRYRKYIRNIVKKISSELFRIVRDRASELNLYTYELRAGSRAETIFLGQADIPTEDVLWKELLIFFMNTKSRQGIINFMKNIPPLGFDPALAGDYLQCFHSDAAKAFVIDELDHLYSEIENSGERLSMMGVVGNPNGYFDDSDFNEDNE